MYFTKNELKYLNDDDFHNGYKFHYNLNPSGLILSRDNYLIDKIKGKRVLHLGFLDHIPLIKTKVVNNTWLHKKLCDHASLCIGLDINQDGIDLCKNLGFGDLYNFNVFTDEVPTELKNKKYDYLVIPDVIEHIGNPVLFLSMLKLKLGDIVENLILSTPNSFQLFNVLYPFRTIEFVNTDHRFWFTPYTLTKIIIDAGCTPKNFEVIQHGSLPKKNILKKIVLQKFPLLRDTIVYEFGF
jgi:hypothetical protein